VRDADGSSARNEIESGGYPLLVRPFELSDEPAVIALWERCGLTRSWNDPRKDIRRKLDVRPELFLVGLVEGIVVASVMAGYEGHRGWINYLAVLPEYQGKGFGRIMMGQAERRLLDLGCPRSISGALLQHRSHRVLPAAGL
jgi:ribosomal protein S18 acetylase RimI-like enzyme